VRDNQRKSVVANPVDNFPSQTPPLISSECGPPHLHLTTSKVMVIV